MASAHELLHVQGPGAVQDLFLHNAAVETQTGRVYGRDDIAQLYLAERAMFAGQRMIESAQIDAPDDIAWTGTFEARHAGPGAFGPPTGRLATITVAEVHTRAGERLSKGWRVRDTARMAADCGVAPDMVAAVMAQAMLDAGYVGWALGEVRAGLGQTEPPLHLPPGRRIGAIADVVQLWTSAWNRRRLDLFSDAYAPNATIHWPAGPQPAAGEPVGDRVLGLLAAVPDGVFFPIHSLGSGDQGALVWRLIGHHTATGFGLGPSGMRVKVLGISTFRWSAGRIVDEKTLFDKLGVQAQILAAMRRHDLGVFAA